MMDDAKRSIISAWLHDVAIGVFSGLYDVYRERLIEIPPEKLGLFLGEIREFREVGEALKRLWKTYRAEAEKYMSVEEILKRAKKHAPEAYRLFSTPRGKKWLEECLTKLHEWLDRGE